MSQPQRPGCPIRDSLTVTYRALAQNPAHLDTYDILTPIGIVMLSRAKYLLLVRAGDERGPSKYAAHF